jgi:hypothetical protein
MDLSDQLYASTTGVTPGKDWQVAGWAPESVWTFRKTEKYLAPAKDPTADLPAHSLSSIVKEVLYVCVYIFS